MTTERDQQTRLVLSWLREDLHEDADRVLVHALDEVDATPQRRSMWPARRFAQMTNYMRIGIAVAALLGVAIVGWNLLPRTDVPGGRPTPSPTTLPTTAPGTVPLATAPPEVSTGKLAPGTYTVSTFAERPFTVTVPAGWGLDFDAFIGKGDYRRGTGVGFGTWEVTHLYPESCKVPRNMKPVPTTADLLSGLAAQTGHVNNGPADVTLGGVPTTRFVFSVPTSFDLSTCDGGVIRLWPGTGGDDASGEPILVAGQTTTVYVIREPTRTTTLVTIEHDRSTSADLAELQAVLDSIVFLP